MSTTAYERIVDKLQELGLRVRTSYSSSVAQGPSHDDRQPSLAVYDKDGRAKIVCFAGCSEELDILPALDMTVADLYDEKRTKRVSGKSGIEPDLETLARIEARRNMTPSQKALDDLLQLPDLGERLCLAIARERPEFYIAEREELEPVKPLKPVKPVSLGGWVNG
jgi:hypothetical protein